MKQLSMPTPLDGDAKDLYEELKRVRRELWACPVACFARRAELRSRQAELIRKVLRP